MAKKTLRGACLCPFALLAAACQAPPANPTGTAAATAETAAQSTPVVVSCPEPCRGIDVSHFSGAVDWPRVLEAGYRFAFVKATEGVDDKDPLFEDHWRALRAAGLARGAYHFYVTEDPPDVQARFFLDTVRHEPGDLTPVVDVELLGRGTPPGLPERLRRFLELVEAEVGVKPIIYTEPNFWDAHLTDEFGDYPLWIADYEVDEPRLPKGFQSWWLWQWQEDARLPGVEKDVDLSRLNHSHVELADLMIPARSPDASSARPGK